MAAVAGPISSVNRVEEGSFPAPIANYPQLAPQISNLKLGSTHHEHAAPSSPAEATEGWLKKFNAALSSGNERDIKTLFTKESYWRDQLCLEFDYHTLHGPEKISDFLTNKVKSVRLQSLNIDDSAAHKKPAASALDFYGKIPCVQAWLKFETDIGRGAGIVKLVQDTDDGNKWKAFTLFTTLRELKGYEEGCGTRRPNGAHHGEVLGRKNWQDRRNAQQNCENDPVVLIVGAGQAGITVAARLKQLGVESLIIDTNERVGDSWRKRYHQLVLHDPVWYDHLPYLEFPKNWPIFTPKDKLAEWFESYVKLMELNTWTSTYLRSAKYDDQKGNWTVELDRMVDGKPVRRTLHPNHVIQATGHSGEKNFPSHIKGISDFTGDRLCHSSEFSGAKENGKGKKAIVVGCCNSGHDIAQDFYEKGYEVSMVQRSSTYVMTSENGLDVLLKGVYEEGGMPVDDADLFFMHSPTPVLKRLHKDATTEISRRDAKLLSGLTAAGFAIDQGPDDAGFFMKYFQRGGGYYLDVGCSQLIADRKISIIQGTEIESIAGKTIHFADGRSADADEIVFATGYQNMKGTAKKIFGEEVADRVKPVWGLDEEGELRTLWRDSGHPGFWFMGGNLALCRYYSRLLALQIKAREVGLLKAGGK